MGKNLKDRYERYKKEHPEEEEIRETFSPVIEEAIVKRAFGYYLGIPPEEAPVHIEKVEITPAPAIEGKKEAEEVIIKPEEIERAKKLEREELERELKTEERELEALKKAKEGDKRAELECREIRSRKRRVKNVALDSITREILKQIKLPRRLYVPYYAIVYGIVKWFVNTYKGIREWDEIDWASLDWGIKSRSETIHGYPHEMAEYIKHEILETYPITAHIKEAKRSMWDLAMEAIQHHTDYVDDLLYRARGGDESAKAELAEAYGITDVDVSDEDVEKAIERVVCKEFGVSNLDELKER